MRALARCAVLGAWLVAAAAASAQGAGAPANPPRTIASLLDRLKEFQVDPAAIARDRAVLAEEPPQGSRARELRDFHYRRANAAQRLGDGAREIEELRKALAYAERTGGAVLNETLSALGVALWTSGNAMESVRVRERVSRRPNLSPQRRLPVHVGLVHVYSELGMREEAAGSLGMAESAYRELMDGDRDRAWEEAYKGWLHWARANVLAGEGRLADAEAALRVAVEAVARDQSNAAARATRIGTREGLAEGSATNWEIYESRLANVVARQGRLTEAEVIARSVLDRVLARQGGQGIQVTTPLNALAGILRSQGRYGEAGRLAEASLAILDTVGAATSSQRRNTAWRHLARARAGQARWADAAAAYEQGRKGFSGEETAAERLAFGELNWGLALVRLGRPAEAVQILEPAHARATELLGDEATSVAMLRACLAIARGKLRQWPEAIALFRRSIPVLLASGAREGERTPAAALDLRRMLEGYVEFLFDLPADAVPAGLDPAGESLRAADVARGQSVNDAISRSTARLAASDPAVAELTRREQDLEQEIRSHQGALAAQANLAPGERSAVAIAEARERVARKRQERRSVQEEIRRRFPRYSELVNPSPTSVDDVRRALAPGEAFLAVLTTETRSFAWAFSRDGRMLTHGTELAEGRVAKAVATLRAALELGDDGRLRPFPLGEAHRLYVALLEPVAPAWVGSHTLIAATSGALAQLPLSLLPTEEAASTAQPLNEDYRRAPWLARRIALSYVPTANALVRLRDSPPAARDRRPLTGFGDPLFAPGSQPVASAATRGPRVRSLAIARVNRGADAPAEIPWTEYARLSPLPDTRDELLAVARVLGAREEGDLHFGASASRARVLATPLADRRVVMFATHGLVPGDLPGLEQPALALAAPSDGAQSPLLTLEDVVSLKLDADMVVLSACNTAAAEGEGAEAISGLGRGFFYAGSRSVLVTHWPVETVSARLLTTGLFARVAADAGLSRARALNASMLSLVDSPPAGGVAYAHPLFWAPFVLVGDPGR